MEFSETYEEDVVPPKPEEEYAQYALKEYAEGREPTPEYDWYCNRIFASRDVIPEEEAADWEKCERFPRRGAIRFREASILRLCRSLARRNST